MKTNEPLWRSVDELKQNEAFQKAQADEFAEDTVAPELDGTTRRHFMGVMGASMAMASLAGCVRRPVDHIVPYSRAPEEFLPGIKQHFATATHIGGQVVGLLVESHEGRPTKIEGNPDHPASFGKASAQHQALVLNLYDPARLRVPRKDRAPTSWEAVEDFFRSHFGALRNKQGTGLAILSEAIPSPTYADLKRRMRATFPNARWVTYEPVSDDNQRIGLQAAFELPVRARHELNMASVVLALDSDFLATEGEAVANAHRWALTRKIETPEAGMSRLYCVEGRYSLTGTNADHRLRLPTSRIEQFTWALLEEVEKLGGAFPVLVTQAAGPITAGLDAKTRTFAAVVAEDLMASRSGSSERFGLVIAGRRATPVVHALTALINLAIGAQSKTVTYFPDPRRADEEPGDMAAIRALTESLKAGQVDTLLVLGVNPVYSVPGDLGFADAIKQAKTTVVLADYPDETANGATWAIPRAHFLEAWGDLASLDGTTSIQQPLIAPLHGAWSELEVLARVLGDEKTDGYTLVRGFWQSRMGGAGFHKKWRRWLHDGVVENPSFGSLPVYTRPQGIGALASKAPGALPDVRNLEVVFVEDPNIHDGRFANNSWLQEAPDPMTKITWDNTFSVNLATAEALRLENEDRADLSVGGKQVAGVVWITPGIADGTVLVTLGYGRSFDNFLPYHDEGKVGFDVGVIRHSDSPDLLTGGKLAKASGKYPLACVQRYGSQEPGFDFEARPLVRENTVEGFKKNPSFAKPGIIEHGKPFPQGTLVAHPEPKSTYPDWDYSQGHQWGMVIDLNTCTGCNACLVACVSENNIMSVGKDQVRRGRELHWIRMDRYFVGDDDEARVVHQPMTCQQCETAPCENVCPVAATAHSPEGLNDMAYNRCIGTRYCANNCPFKVRRFNFYNYSKGQDELIHMQRNPNVTVRFRGVMEKCTYCTQRINDGKRQARMARQNGREDDARKLVDAIMPACQQTCPTDAITFGDINDKGSKVAKLKALSRDYQLLSELNLHPRTSYLAKVRNPNPKLVG